MGSHVRLHGAGLSRLVQRAAALFILLSCFHSGSTEVNAPLPRVHRHAMAPSPTATLHVAKGGSVSGDFGDAPDQTNPGFGPDRGQYPTRMPSTNAAPGRGGPVHRTVGQEFLGHGVTIEAAPHQGDDSDDDDGFLGLMYRPGKTPVPVVARFRVELGIGAPTVSRYVNVLFDSDRNGRWKDPVVGLPEWVGKDLPVTVNSGFTVVTTPEFNTDFDRDYIVPSWIRATITRESITAMTSSWDGSATFEGFSHGETEDWYFPGRERHPTNGSEAYVLWMPESVKVGDGGAVFCICLVNPTAEPIAGPALSFTPASNRISVVPEADTIDLPAYAARWLPYRASWTTTGRLRTDSATLDAPFAFRNTLFFQEPTQTGQMWEPIQVAAPDGALVTADFNAVLPPPELFLLPSSPIHNPQSISGSSGREVFAAYTLSFGTEGSNPFVPGALVELPARIGLSRASNIKLDATEYVIPVMFSPLSGTWLPLANYHVDTAANAVLFETAQSGVFGLAGYVFDGDIDGVNGVNDDDVQLATDEAVDGGSAADVDGNGVTDATDIQLIIAAMKGQRIIPPPVGGDITLGAGIVPALPGTKVSMPFTLSSGNSALRPAAVVFEVHFDESVITPIPSELLMEFDETLATGAGLKVAYTEGSGRINYVVYGAASQLPTRLFTTSFMVGNAKSGVSSPVEVHKVSMAQENGAALLNAKGADGAVILSEDADGDGIPNAVETSRFGTDPLNPDTDGDGMPDGFEVLYRLRPLDPSDAEKDADADRLTNREEYHRRSNPRDAASPRPVFFVAPTGIDAAAGGTSAAPWRTIAFALARIQLTRGEASPSEVALLLAPGTYTENVSMLPEVAIVGASPGSTTIEGHIDGAPNAALADLRVQQREGNSDFPLLTIDHETVHVSRVHFQGTDARTGIGIAVYGILPGNGFVSDCVFTKLACGVVIIGRAPNIRRSLFTNLSECALTWRNNPVKDGETQSAGSADDANTGYNTFEDLDGPAVVNETDVLVQVENADWGTNDPDGVQIQTLGAVDYTPYLKSGFGLIPATIVCSLWNSTTLLPVTSATVTLTGAANLSTSVHSQGVYTFASVPGGQYTASATATNYLTPSSQSTNVSAGTIRSLSFPMVSVSTNDIDSDGDGLSDALEAELGTNPNLPDTDDDGINDNVEVAYGTDPLTPDVGLTSDANKDGTVNALDIQLVVNRVLGLNVPQNCDVNRDGSVNALDIQIAVNVLLGVI